MKNKPGFKVNIGGETIVYLIIGVVIVAFIFLMPNMYKLISDFKTGNLFKDNNTPVVENSNQEKEEEKPNESTGKTTLVCALLTSKPEGNLEEKYIFNFKEEKLESLTNEKYYDAVTDEYLNYVYSEQARFNKIGDLYKNVKGFNFGLESDTNSLKVTFLYDLTKLNPKLLENSEEKLSIKLNVTRNQSLEEVQKTYKDLGYTCR